ncbi:hypothetical protein DFH28DRAFT_1132730 [Melampsora americana]|nr:hypothetical protein DFH28DRAFT_1132730 [Melampsora americana]
MSNQQPAKKAKFLDSNLEDEYDDMKDYFAQPKYKMDDHTTLKPIEYPGFWCNKTIHATYDSNGDLKIHCDGTLGMHNQYPCKRQYNSIYAGTKLSPSAHDIQAKGVKKNQFQMSNSLRLRSFSKTKFSIIYLLFGSLGKLFLGTGSRTII